MRDVMWLEGDRVRVTPPNTFKKITGTHFPTVLGANPYATPFEVWCRCTRTYEKPFDGNKYTHAGKVIEPKVFEFLRRSMGFGSRVITPEDVYGEDPYKVTYGDFYKEVDIFGGMWDALIMGADGKPEYVVEVKTVLSDGRQGNLDARWKGGEAPHYQALQAALYAYLLGIDKVLMVGVSLKEKQGDYEHPEQVTPSYSKGNVYIDSFRVSERYPNFDMYIDTAKQWWESFVKTGISPVYDEKRDADILSALRTHSVMPEADMAELVQKAEHLMAEIRQVTDAVTEKEILLNKIMGEIRRRSQQLFREGDKKVSVRGETYEFTMLRTEGTELDKEALAADGLLEKYTKPKINYRLITSRIKEE